MTGGPESEWKITLGKEIQNSVVALSQIFIIVELLMYIILFRHVYCYNKELKNGKSLGLPADTLLKRQKKNVITIFGQCLSFVIESLGTFFISVAIHLNFTTFYVRILGNTFLVASYFVALPELRRFYFKM